MKKHSILIRIYPALIILISSALLFGSAYYYKSTPDKEIVKIVETKYIKSDPTVIKGDGYEIKRKVGDTWSWGEIRDYNLHIKGEKRYEVAIIIIINCKALPITSEYGEIILTVEPDNITQVMDFVRSLD